MCRAWPQVQGCTESPAPDSLQSMGTDRQAKRLLVPGRQTDRHTGNPGGCGHSRCMCPGEFRETGAPGAEQVVAWPWLGSLSWPRLGARPCQWGCSIPVYLRSEAKPRPGSRATCDRLHQKLQKTARGPSDCRPLPSAALGAYANLKLDAPLAPHPTGETDEGCYPPGPAAGPPTIPTTGRDQDGARAP